MFLDHPVFGDLKEGTENEHHDLRGIILCSLSPSRACDGAIDVRGPLHVQFVPLWCSERVKNLSEISHDTCHMRHVGTRSPAVTRRPFSYGKCG